MSKGHGAGRVLLRAAPLLPVNDGFYCVKEINSRRQVQIARHAPGFEGRILFPNMNFTPLSAGKLST
jgi:hypothetical protein